MFSIDRGENISEPKSKKPVKRHVSESGSDDDGSNKVLFCFLLFTL